MQTFSLTEHEKFKTYFHIKNNLSEIDKGFLDNFYTDGLITSLKISNDAENTKILREVYKYILEFGVDSVQEKKLFEFRTGTITKKIAFIQGIDIGVKIMDFYYNGIDKLAPQGFIDDFYRKLDILNNYNKNLPNTLFN